MNTFLLKFPFPRPEILATQSQYKTWEEFMSEILSEVPREQKSRSRYWYS